MIYIYIYIYIYCINKDKLNDMMINKGLNMLLVLNPQPLVKIGISPSPKF